MTRNQVLETDKVSVEVYSPHAGVLRELPASQFWNSPILERRVSGFGRSRDRASRPVSCGVPEDCIQSPNSDSRSGL